MEIRPRTIACLQPLTVAVLLAAIPAPGWAGIFNKNQPVPDWALQANKTHTPDYAKDASSVVLYEEYVESVDGSGRATERHRKVMRVLKPQGRKRFCDVGYDVDEKINYFRAWTIAADEKQYMAQDTDFAEVGDTSVPIMLSTHKVRVAIPPAIDVGATVVCESEEILQPYLHETIWDIQQNIPVVFQALEVDLPAGRPHAQSWHSFKSVAAARSLSQPLALGIERHARARLARYPFAARMGGTGGPHERAMGRRRGGWN